MKSKLIKIGVISLAILFSVFNFTYAANPMDIYNVNNNDSIVNAAVIIAGFLKYAALAIAIGMLMIKGIKFVLAAPEGKADIKKQMIPWAIGIFLLFMLTAILNIVQDMAQNFNG